MSFTLTKKKKLVQTLSPSTYFNVVKKSLSILATNSSELLRHPTLINTSP